jgi:hypothetical protein
MYDTSASILYVTSISRKQHECENVCSSAKSVKLEKLIASKRLLLHCLQAGGSKQKGKLDIRVEHSTSKHNRLFQPFYATKDIQQA